MTPDIEATTSFRLLFASTSIPILNSVDFFYAILVPSSPKTRLLDASRLIHSASGSVSVITTPFSKHYVLLCITSFEAYAISVPSAPEISG